MVGKDATMKIQKLSKNRLDKLSEYKDRYIKTGLSTDRIDRKEAEKIINDFRVKVLKLKKAPVFIFDDPIQSWMGIFVIFGLLKQVGNQVGNQVWNQVRSQVRSQVKDQVKDQVYVYVRISMFGVF